MDAQLSAITGVPRRALGEQERLLHMIQGFGGLLAGQVLHIRGALDAALVRRALDHMQRSHPILGAHLESRGIRFIPRLPFIEAHYDLVMAGTEPIPLTEATGDWRELLRAELKRPIPRDRKPRIRATLVHPGGDGITRVIFLADHAIGDAPAAALGAHTFMSFLADPTLEPTPLTDGLPPALEELYPAKSDSGRSEEPAIRLPDARQPGAKLETWIAERDFSAAELAAMKSAAATNRTTIHGVLGAAVLTALHERYRLDIMSLLSTFEFRRLCRPPLPAATYGCYIDILRTTHAVGGAFWPLAREVAFKLIATVARDQQSASILRWPPFGVLLRETWRSARSANRVDAVAVTTGGETPLLRSYGSFTLEDVTVCISMHAYGPSMFFATQERLGGLRLTVCYTPAAIAAAEVEAMVDRTAAILRALPA